MISKKSSSLLGIFLVLTSVIAFSYLVGQENQERKDTVLDKAFGFVFSPMIPLVSANDFVPTGCCLETKSGATCQDMNLFDSASCKSDLLGNTCNVVAECQKGCCYDASSGICGLNAPKQQCESSGSIWKNDASCNIAECQLGCCVLGDSVAMTSTRECSVLSEKYNLQKDFRNLDSQGSCNAYTDLSSEGACLLPSNDFSNQKSCVLTTKGKCSGEFKQGYLCTSEELNTACEKTTETSCIEGKDEIYFLDSCGNRANVYDATKATNQSYWEKIISSSNSCSAGSSNCGNCDYATGSICKKYDSKKDSKPKYGDYVCRNLDCGDKKNGEAWCISDYDAAGILSSSIGSRNYVAKCLENEISLEPCADFNQEICIQSNGTSYSQAQCIPNEWRTCLQANEKDTYEEVKLACDQNPQCIMFLDIPGNEQYKGLPGFKDSGLNSDQARAGDIGKDANKVLAHCVPRYPAGTQFWTTPSNPFAMKNGQQESTASYGGSKEETDAICSLGSFTCVSHIETETSIAGGGSAQDKQNPECNIDAVSQGNQKVSLLMEALDERCRSLGPCGTQTNIQGQFGGVAGFKVSRVYIDKEGKQKTAKTDEYVLSGDSLKKISQEQSSIAMGSIKSLNDLPTTSGGASIAFLFLNLLTGKAVGDQEVASEQASQSADQTSAEYQQDQQTTTGVAGAIGTLGYQGLSGIGTSTISSSSVQAGFSQVVSSGTVTTASGQVIHATASAPVYLSSEGAGNLAVHGGLEGAATETSTASVSGAGTNWGAIGTQLAVTAAAMVAAYFIGKMIAKNSGMSPAESNNFIGAMMAGASLLVAGYSAAAYAYGWAGALCAGVVTCVAGVVIALAYFVYSLYSTSTDHEYYILTYTCQAWEPPKQGDCSVCNSDVRPCSEYKCRSLGNNCHYFNDNGEPGYCASLADIWQAKITPWQQVLTEGNKYTKVADNSFYIEGLNVVEVAPWQPLTFGIITDKQAICKIGFNTSASFDSFGTQMVSQLNYDTGRVDGMHHEIVLSPNIKLTDFDESSSTTVPISAGENEYYIKCRNFAGQENEAPFVVKVSMSEGPDLTPPTIVAYSPQDNSYIKVGQDNLTFTALLNEPAECSYSKDYDQNYYSEMPFNMSCQTDPSQGYYGQWPCTANLQNITENPTKVFIKCKDQPALEETDLIKRVETPRSFTYTINKCEKNLSINLISPLNNSLIDDKNKFSVDLKISTSGCIGGGIATCTYRVDNIGTNFATFVKTDGINHEQTINGLGQGDHFVDLSCQDAAGNIANSRVDFSINFDSEPPQITRVYKSGKTGLVIKTNEPAECIYHYSPNLTNDCDFSFENSTNYYSTTFSLSNLAAGNYFLRCRDNKLNEPLGCTEIINVK